MSSKHKQSTKIALSHGGKRQGADLKLKLGPFGEETKVMRNPESKVPAIKQWLERLKQGEHEAIPETAIETMPMLLPIYGHKVAAGFPSPAEGLHNFEREKAEWQMNRSGCLCGLRRDGMN